MNIHTLFNGYGLLCIAAAVSLSFVVRAMPLASRLWVAALYPTGIAALMTSHRGLLGHDIGYTFATSLQFFAALLMCLGLLAFEKRERKWSDFGLATTVAVGIHLLLSIPLSRLDEQIFQGLFVTVTFAITAFWGGAIAGRIATSSGYRSAIVLQWTFYVVGALWSLRLYVLLSGRGINAFDPVTINIIIFTGQFIFGIARWFSFAAMESERVIHNTRIAAERIRQQAAELAERNSSLASAMLAAPAACIVTDRIGRIVYLNGEAKRFLGTASEDMVGRELTRAFIAIDPKPTLDDGLVHQLFMRPHVTGQSRLLEVRSQSFSGDAKSMQRVFVVRELQTEPERIFELVGETNVAPGRAFLACEPGGAISAMAYRGSEPAVRQAMQDARNLWEMLEQILPGDRSLARAKSRALSGAVASALLRAPNGLVYDVAFSTIITTNPDRPVLLAEIRILKSGFRHAARALLENRSEADTDSTAGMSSVNVPASLRRS